MRSATPPQYTYTPTTFGAASEAVPYRPTCRRHTGKTAWVITALAAAAAGYAAGGYHVIVDGIVGPWFMERFCAALDPAPEELHYVVLRPDESTTRDRALKRGPGALTVAGPIQSMYRQFADLGPYERHVIDSTTLDAAATAERIHRTLTSGQFLIRSNGS